MDAALIANGIVTQVERNVSEAPEGWLLFPSDTVVCGMLWDGFTLSSPPPSAQARNFRHIATARFAIVNGAPVASQVLGFGGVLRVGTGRYRINFNPALSGDQYSPNVSTQDVSGRLDRINKQTATYLEIVVTDAAGVAVDPQAVSINVRGVD